MPLVAISVDIFQWHHLLQAANNPPAELITFHDSTRGKALDIENNAT